MLLVVVALRSNVARLPWARSGATGRQRDLVKAGLLLTAFVAATVTDCWIAVALGEHVSSWNGRTAWLLVALGLLTAAVPVVTWLGLRDLHDLPIDDGGDWVGDVLPAPFAAWVRRRDRAVFLGASGVAAVVIIGSLAYGERWTDPLLIGWALAAEVACYYAFCVITNAVLGFVDPPRKVRFVELAVVLGSLTLQVAVAFHGQLAPRVGFGSPNGVPRLVEATFGPAALVFVGPYIVLRLRRPRSWPAPPAR